MDGLARLFKPIAMFLAVTLGGCCAFVPCHPGTWIVGSVKATTGEAIPGAKGKLYGTAFSSSSAGCFTIHQADAQPHALIILADGFKRIEVPAKFGHFEVQVKLASSNSESAGEVIWKSITADAYLRAVGNGCP